MSISVAGYVRMLILGVRPWVSPQQGEGEHVSPKVIYILFIVFFS